MIGKAKKKLISSLSHKKYRDKTGLFVAEGPKLVKDLLIAGMEPELILTTNSALFEAAPDQPSTAIIDNRELKQLSFLKNPREVIAIFRKPNFNFTFGEHSESLTLCLDGIQDPGNMGTILRLADWFSIPNVVCSPDTADVFNPKVVQASMGAFARTKVHYTPLSTFCQRSAEELNLEVFGTFMEGENIYSLSLPRKGIIVLGNEGNGIRPETERTITTRLTIPKFGNPTAHSSMESLNVGMAAAIMCSEFHRSIF
ncbi:TrmH family RNA methyltransferase [Thermophagus sp. OGC60D27]|uniref:TrmH family RNA methyltransferase n=1 Tax=Thermophagus sp. OGC60D27 TaxID=3458415 RepID=UPI0040383722